MSSESTMLGVKFLMIYVLEFVAVALVAAVVVGGVYNLIRGKIRQLQARALATEKQTVTRS